MALVTDSEIYDHIVDQYTEAKSNLYKKHVEEPTFWKCAGDDFKGQTVLDLACGSGYYSRQFRIRGAKQVVGVDVSKEMIEEAKKLGDPEDAASGSSNSLTYITANATDLSAYMPLSNQKEGFDVVTCQYLFPYASNKEELFQMIKAAFVGLKLGGSFVGVTTCLDPARPLKAKSSMFGIQMTWEGESEGAALFDGVCVQITLLDAKGQSTVSFPNYFWSKDTITKLLSKAGFTGIKWQEEVCDKMDKAGQEWFQKAHEEYSGCGYFVAKKQNMI